MKKVASILFLLLVLLVGIKIGSSNDIKTTPSDLFEDAKDEFEENIIIPGNNYENINLKPKEYLPNKIANKISELLEKLADKIA